MTPLPYPHARHDCAACQEFDADVELLDENGQPHKPPRELCQRCLGKHIAFIVIDRSGPDLDQPVPVHVRPAAGRRA